MMRACGRRDAVAPCVVVRRPPRRGGRTCHSIGFQVEAAWSYCIHRLLTPSHWMYALRAASHCGSLAEPGDAAEAAGVATAAAVGGAAVGGAEGALMGAPTGPPID